MEMSDEAQAQMRARAGMHTFTLTDKSGDEHQYVVALHNAEAGHDIAWKLQGMGMPALVGVVKAMAAAEGVQEMAAAMQGQGDGETTSRELIAGAAGGFVEAMSKMDTSELSSALENLFGHSEMPGLAKRILENTSRDGQPLKVGYALAYRGNYGEMMQAVVKVALLNDFFPVARLFGDSGGA